MVPCSAVGRIAAYFFFLTLCLTVCTGYSKFTLFYEFGPKGSK